MFIDVLRRELEKTQNKNSKKMNNATVNINDNSLMQYSTKWKQGPIYWWIN